MGYEFQLLEANEASNPEGMTFERREDDTVDTIKSICGVEMEISKLRFARIDPPRPVFRDSKIVSNCMTISLDSGKEIPHGFILSDEPVTIDFLPEVKSEGSPVVPIGRAEAKVTAREVGSQQPGAFYARIVITAATSNLDWEEMSSNLRLKPKDFPVFVPKDPGPRDEILGTRIEPALVNSDLPDQVSLTVQSMHARLGLRAPDNPYKPAKGACIRTFVWKDLRSFYRQPILIAFHGAPFKGLPSAWTAHREYINCCRVPKFHRFYIRRDMSSTGDTLPIKDEVEYSRYLYLEDAKKLWGQENKMKITLEPEGEGEGKEQTVKSICGVDMKRSEDCRFASITKLKPSMPDPPPVFTDKTMSSNISITVDNGRFFPEKFVLQEEAATIDFFPDVSDTRVPFGVGRAKGKITTMEVGPHYPGYFFARIALTAHTSSLDPETIERETWVLKPSDDNAFVPVEVRQRGLILGARTEADSAPMTSKEQVEDVQRMFNALDLDLGTGSSQSAPTISDVRALVRVYVEPSEQARGQ